MLVRNIINQGKPAVFLDLNGTLVLPVQAEKVEEFTLIPGCEEAILRLNDAGFICPIVTVQSRIEKGIYSETAFRAWFAAFRMNLELSGARIYGPYLCPHRPQTVCHCAKPLPFLYHQAAAELNIDLTKSFVVGDTAGDMGAAVAIGATGCLVRTGWGPKPGDPLEMEAAFVGADLQAVAEWIVQHPV